MLLTECKQDIRTADNYSPQMYLLINPTYDDIDVVGQCHSLRVHVSIMELEKKKDM